MQRYAGRSREYLTKAARTFSIRRFAGKSRALDGAHITGEEFGIFEEIDKEMATWGIDPKRERGGILGKADQIMQLYPARFTAFPLHLWKRRDLWKRLRWLKGELTRIITRKVTFKSEDERHAALLKRRDQIAKYEEAMRECKPLHDEIRRLHRLDAQAERRRKTTKARRHAEIKTALEASRSKLGKSRRTIKHD